MFLITVFGDNPAPRFFTFHHLHTEQLCFTSELTEKVKFNSKALS